MRSPVLSGQSAKPALLHRRRLSLRGLLVLLVAAVALPLIALAGVALWHAHHQGQARAEAELLGQARVMAAAVDREFDQVRAGLRALANSAAMEAEDLAGVEAEMRAMSAQWGGTAIALVAADGSQLLGTNWARGERRTGRAGPPAAALSLATGRVAVSDLIYSSRFNDHLVAVVMPVPAPAADGARRGQPTHAFAAALPSSRLAAVLRGRAGSNGEAEADAPVAAVIDRAGVVVARTRGEATFVGKPVRPAFATRLAEDTEGLWHNATTYEGDPAIFAFATAPRSGYTAAVSLPEATFSAPLHDALWRYGLLSAVLLTAGAGLAALVGSRIAGALHRVAGTVPEHPVPEGSALRELDEVAHAVAERNRAVARLADSERRFRALAEAGALAIWHGDASGAILESQGWQALTGQPDTALRGNGWLAMLHPADRDTVVAAWEATRQAGTPLDLEFRVQTRSGEWRWVRTRGVRVGEADVVAEWVGVIEDVHDQRQAALALVDRQERLRLAVEAARLSTWEYDPANDRASRIGRSGETLLAPGAPAFTLADWTASIHPEDRPGTLALLQATIEGRAPEFAAEFRVRRRPPEEGWAWVMSHGAVAERDPASGAVLRIAGVAQDITERREAEQRRALLAREVDHRARNVLAVVQSILRLTRRDQPEAFVAAVEARVAALARAHTLLAEAGWLGADLHMLAERELARFPPGIVELEGPVLAVAATAVQPLAMVLHELATNAAKHGAASCLEGRVTLRWAIEGTDTRTVRLEWIERGGPRVDEAPARRGFGSRMLDAIVRGQLGGTLALQWAAAGLECRIILPAARLLSADPPGPLRRARRPEPVSPEA